MPVFFVGVSVSTVIVWLVRLIPPCEGMLWFIILRMPVVGTSFNEHPDLAP